MSVVKQQAKELGVDAAGGAKDGGQERDTMIVSVGGGREGRLLLVRWIY